jgi:hypothetical protein
MTLPRAALVGFAAAAIGCSLGEGEGEVVSDHLFAHDCWGVEENPDDRPGYRLRPDFFAAIPYRDTLQIRVQRGNDLEEVSDGLMVLIDDVKKVGGRLGRAERVSLPAGVRPPGAPLEPPTTELLDDPALIHMTLYLQSSCHNQNINLYAINGTITFQYLFSGDPNESVGANKFTDATFDVEVGDLSDVRTGDPISAIPEDKRTHLSGYFRFYFQRGQPAQPFP